MGYGLALHTAPTSEPVSLEEAKKQTETVGMTHHDQHLLSLVTAARGYIERRLNRQLMTATWDLSLDRFPCSSEPLLIPYAPLVSITSITYLDSAGDSQTWSSSSYRVSTSREPGRVVPVFGQLYPATYPTTDSVVVRFVAGYGEATSVPEGIKQAIKLLVSHWFEERSPVGTVGREIAFSLESLLANYGYGDEFTCYGEEREVLA